VSRLLLDSDAFLWFVANDAALSERARDAVEAADHVLLSVASAWELAIKVKTGKLTLGAGTARTFFDEQMRANRFDYLPILTEHVLRAADLPLHHRDPFNRLLIAQALTEGSFSSPERTSMPTLAPLDPRAYTGRQCLTVYMNAD
jgi:PIN domain nuclease of toxin-antitoxin system